VIKHSPAAIAVSSSCSRRGNRRSIRNAGFHHQCVVRHAGKSESRTEIRVREGMTPAPMAAEGDTPRGHVSSIRRSVRTVAGRPRSRSCRARTSRSIAANVFKRCADSSNRATASTNRRRTETTEIAVGLPRPHFSLTSIPSLSGQSARPRRYVVRVWQPSCTILFCGAPKRRF
jgi:hypothetical protein